MKSLALKRVFFIFQNFIYVFLCPLLLVYSTIPPADEVAKIRAFTRDIEFDFVQWTLMASYVKNSQTALDVPRYLSLTEQRTMIDACLQVTGRIETVQRQIDIIYANPDVSNPAEASSELLKQWDELEQISSVIQPVCETILQQQVSAILAESNLSLGGQAVPPLLYHVTPLPMALIVSPRDRIEQKANISLLANLSTEDIVTLEERVSDALNVSTLVVPIGGVGIYPTMVMRTTNLKWTIETISHEWIHNYLTLRPLGLLYDATPELRTMNETTASLAGKEIGLAVLQKFYPDLAPPPPQPSQTAEESQAPPAPEPPQFDFRAEMHLTRVTVDNLLAEGKIEEAEQYMEARRRIFWDNGYLIRKLNQAYFAFYGAYADVPGGAAGEDPVGPLVVKLRQQSASLADFLRKIGWMTSFEDLQQAVQK